MGRTRPCGRVWTRSSRCHSVPAVLATTPVWMEQPAAPAAGQPYRTARRWTVQTVGSVAAALPATAWRRIAVAAGSKGPRLYDWAAVRVTVGDHGWPGPALAPGPSVDQRRSTDLHDDLITLSVP